ncbi:MAG TPA: hypothetical protein VGG10_05290 [Rhizomicrobium sp.]|jgi:hypothetical protein
MTAAAGYPGFGRTGFVSRAIMVVAALAFILQSFVTQTHIHLGPQDLASVTKLTSTAQVSGHGKTSHDRSPVDCPFCQAIAVSGVFLAASGPALHLPFVWIITQIRDFEARTLSVRIAHNWQSRAPPSL